MCTGITISIPLYHHVPFNYFPVEMPILQNRNFVIVDMFSKFNMAAEKLVRDVGDVYSKLFNHNGPISREINFYVQEFETKRKDRELSRLNQAGVNCGHIESLLPEVENFSKECLQTVLDKTQNAIKKANAMLENKLPEENLQKVEETRSRMEKEWTSFEEKTNASREQAEQCHIERMTSLKMDIERLNEGIKGK